MSVTMLADLEDLDGPPMRQHAINQFGPAVGEHTDRPAMYDQIYQKHIRGGHQPAPGAGMGGYGGHPSGGMQGPMENYGPPPSSDGEGSAPPPPNLPSDPVNSISCIDIHRHIQGCPICSKFYNDDKTVYIIVIVLLAIVCMLLLKKVLNV